MARIILVDDEGSLLKVLTTVLTVAGRHDVVATPDATHAAELIKEQAFDLMISDIRMAPMDGMQLLRIARKIRPEMVVIMATAFSSLETALEAYDLGVFDYVAKPFKVDELLETATAAINFKEEQARPTSQDVPLEVEYCLEKIVAKSTAMRGVCDVVRRIGPTDMPVLVAGPRGSGRRLVAEAIHATSTRRGKPFTAVTCVQQTDQQMDLELFGRGHTAVEAENKGTRGAFVDAHMGTLFIEEIDKMSSSMQSKLVAVMREKKVRRAGADEAVPADVRIVTSTSKVRDLKNGILASDLYRLLSGMTIEIPPLRDRWEDVLPLAVHFIKADAERSGRAPVRLSQDAGNALMAYTWPDDARQLREVVSHATAAAKDGMVTLESLPKEVRAAAGSARASGMGAAENPYRGRNLRKFIQKERKKKLLQIIDDSGGDRKKAARALGISLADLNRQLDDASA